MYDHMCVCGYGVAHVRAMCGVGFVQDAPIIDSDMWLCVCFKFSLCVVQRVCMCVCLIGTCDMLCVYTIISYAVQMCARFDTWFVHV